MASYSPGRWPAQGLGLIQAIEQVDVLAEIGVILLLFTIGLEISLKDLMQMKKYVLVGEPFRSP